MLSWHRPVFHIRNLQLLQDSRRSARKIAMASAKTSIAQLSKSAFVSSLRPQARLPQTIFLPPQQFRCAATGTSANAAKYKRKDQSGTQKKKKARPTFIQYDIRDAEQFSLCDAMQYVFAIWEGVCGTNWITRSGTSAPSKLAGRPPRQNTKCTLNYAR